MIPPAEKNPAEDGESPDYELDLPSTAWQRVLEWLRSPGGLTLTAIVVLGALALLFGADAYRMVKGWRAKQLVAAALEAAEDNHPSEIVRRINLAILMSPEDLSIQRSLAAYLEPISPQDAFAAYLALATRENPLDEDRRKLVQFAAWMGRMEEVPFDPVNYLVEDGMADEETILQAANAILARSQFVRLEAIIERLEESPLRRFLELRHAIATTGWDETALQDMESLSWGGGLVGQQALLFMGQHLIDGTLQFSDSTPLRMASMARRLRDPETATAQSLIFAATLALRSGMEGADDVFPFLVEEFRTRTGLERLMLARWMSAVGAGAWMADFPIDPREANAMELAIFQLQALVTASKWDLLREKLADYTALLDPALHRYFEAELARGRGDAEAEEKAWRDVRITVRDSRPSEALFLARAAEAEGRNADSALIYRRLTGLPGVSIDAFMGVVRTSGSTMSARERESLTKEFLRAHPQHADHWAQTWKELPDSNASN